MATAVDSGRGAVSAMTSMESWASDRGGGTTSDTVGELVAVLAQSQWTEEENAVIAPWYRPCSRTREEAEMIDAGNDSSVVGREREEAKMIDPVGGAANCSVHGGRGHEKKVCTPLQRQCSRRMTESRPR